MIFEKYIIFVFKRPRMIFHWIDGLNFSVIKAIYKFKAGNLFSVCIFNELLILFPLSENKGRNVIPLWNKSRKIILHPLIKVNGSSGISSFERNKFDNSFLILLLLFNMDNAILQVNLIPFQTVALIDTQSAIASQHIGGFCVCSVKISIQFGTFFIWKGDDIQILVGFHLRHMNLCIFVFTKAIVKVKRKITAWICLTENKVKHL